MPRVKRGVMHVKNRRNLLKKTKGYKWGRKSKMRQATTAAMKAGAHSYQARRVKKRDARRLWNIKINAGVRPLGLTYSKLIDKLTTKKVLLDRKVLADLAENHPTVFAKIVEAVK